MRSVHGIRRLLLIAAALCLLALGALADPVAHVYFEPDPSEDLRFQTTTSGGAMPAAIDTPSGVVQAPNGLRPPDVSERPYGGTSTPDSVDSTYQVDRNTTRPDVVGYDDPFIPAVTPFKRLYAYDSVDDRLELVVYGKELSAIKVGGAANAGDDQFYADMIVDLAKDVPVRIPSVGPDARVLAADARVVGSNKPVAFSVVRDHADNWFIRAGERQRVRLTMQLAVERNVFGSEFPDVDYGELSPELSPLPDSARQAAREVLAQIGVSRALRPRAALGLLVAHFRNFAPSEDRPSSVGVQLYKELSLSQKGVCRHRAYAFVITALELGLPARMLRNEAHAWVEVYDGRIWHRIDLGGAAGRLSMQRDENAARHSAPPDPFQWPPGGEPASSLVGSDQDPNGSPSTPQPGDAGTADSPRPPNSGLAPLPGPPTGANDLPQADDPRPATSLTFRVDASSISRGAPLLVSGTVRADGNACANLRIDVALKDAERRVFIGAVPSNERGEFERAVIVPLDIGVGDYDVVLSTPGDAHCGPGQSG